MQGQPEHTGDGLAAAGPGDGGEEGAGGLKEGLLAGMGPDGELKVKVVQVGGVKEIRLTP